MPLPTRLGISRPAVRRFLAAEQFPERLSGPKRRQRQSIVAPSLPSSASAGRLGVTTDADYPVTAPKRRRLSSQQASWLFVLPKEKLTPEQQRQLEQMCQGSRDLSTAYELSQDFLGILKERRAHVYDFLYGLGTS